MSEFEIALRNAIVSENPYFKRMGLVDMGNEKMYLETLNFVNRSRNVVLSKQLIKMILGKFVDKIPGVNMFVTKESFEKMKVELKDDESLAIAHSLSNSNYTPPTNVYRTVAINILHDIVGGGIENIFPNGMEIPPPSGHNKSIFENPSRKRSLEKTEDKNVKKVRFMVDDDDKVLDVTKNNVSLFDIVENAKIDSETFAVENNDQISNDMQNENFESKTDLQTNEENNNMEIDNENLFDNFMKNENAEDKLNVENVEATENVTENNTENLTLKENLPVNANENLTETKNVSVNENLVFDSVNQLEKTNADDNFHVIQNVERKEEPTLEKNLQNKNLEEFAQEFQNFEDSDDDDDSESGSIVSNSSANKIDNFNLFEIENNPVSFSGKNSEELIVGTEKPQAQHTVETTKPKVQRKRSTKNKQILGTFNF